MPAVFRPDDGRMQQTGFAMRHTTTHSSREAPHDDGAAGFVVWIVLYAVFMVALLALQGGTGAIPIR